MESVLYLQSPAEENTDDEDNNHDDDDLVTGRQDVAVVVTNADECHSLISSPVPDEAGPSRLIGFSKKRCFYQLLLC